MLIPKGLVIAGAISSTQPVLLHNRCYHVFEVEKRILKPHKSYKTSYFIRVHSYRYLFYDCLNIKKVCIKLFEL